MADYVFTLRNVRKAHGDKVVLDLNQRALPRLECESRLAVVPSTTPMFEEPGALGQVTDLASGWFARHFALASTIAPAA